MKKKSFLKTQYSKCLSFFKDSKNYFLIVIFLFTFFFLLGLIFPVFFREQIIEAIKKMVESIEGKSWIGTVSFIFLNNLKISFLAIVLGVGLGIFPLLTNIVNAYLLGFVSRVVIEKESVFVLWRLLPHGIFELPAIILSIGIGFRLGLSVFKKKGTLKKDFKEAMRFFFFVIFPLLLLAGIIEGTLIILFK